MALLVVTRFVVADGGTDGCTAGGTDGGAGDGTDGDGGGAAGREFQERAREALAALSARPGCLRGHLGRSMDDPSRWVMQTEWDSVGSYRRALSSYDVKVRAVPVMYEAVDELSAYEVLVGADPDGITEGRSDLSEAAATAAPGERPDR